MFVGVVADPIGSKLILYSLKHRKSCLGVHLDVPRVAGVHSPEVVVLRAESRTASARLLGVALNQWHRARRTDHAFRKRLADRGVPLFAAAIRDTVRVKEAYEAQMPVGELYPDHPVTNDYLRLAREVVRIAKETTA